MKTQSKIHLLKVIIAYYEGILYFFHKEGYKDEQDINMCLDYINEAQKLLNELE